MGTALTPFVNAKGDLEPSLFQARPKLAFGRYPNWCDMTPSKLLALTLALLLSAAAAANDGLYLAGADYRELPQRLPSAGAESGKIQIIEFFWYGCPHCYALEPYLESWMKSGMPAEATYVRVPAALNPSWRVHAKAFYVAEALHLLDQIHQAMFDAIHQERQSLSDEASIRALFLEHGADGAKFDAAWRSYAVEAKLRRAESLARMAGINGVPTMVVGGRFESTVTLAGGREELLQVVNYLVTLAQEMSAKGE